MKASSKQAFTMIELIFVIVIIGILAAVAIPKLAATRDDAKISVEIASTKQGLLNLAAEYTAKAENTQVLIDSSNSLIDCFTFTETGVVGDLTDGNITITPVAVAGTADCPAIIAAAVNQLAVNNNIIDAVATPKEYAFGGAGVVE